MAREGRDRFGTRRTGGGRRVAFNPLGGKRKGEETGRQTAAREAYEETKEHLSAAAKRGICDGAPGVWAGDGTKSYVYVYRSPKGSDAGLHEKWRSVYTSDANVEGRPVGAFSSSSSTRRGAASTATASHSR